MLVIVVDLEELAGVVEQVGLAQMVMLVYRARMVGAAGWAIVAVLVVQEGAGEQAGLGLKVGAVLVESGPQGIVVQKVIAVVLVVPGAVEVLGEVAGLEAAEIKVCLEYTAGVEERVTVVALEALEVLEEQEVVAELEVRAVQVELVPRDGVACRVHRDSLDLKVIRVHVDLRVIWAGAVQLARKGGAERKGIADHPNG